jgi:hypothetical protein
VYTHNGDVNGDTNGDSFPLWMYQLVLSSIIIRIDKQLPSGKRTKNYGKPPFLMGKSNINGHFQ